jgi:60S ribosome biogenesis protein Rrp14
VGPRQSLRWPALSHTCQNILRRGCQRTYTVLIAAKILKVCFQDQWKRKKQTPEQKRVAKMAKLDPANWKSAKDVMDERQAEFRKRKREEDGELSDSPMIEPEKPKANQNLELPKVKKRKTVDPNVEPSIDPSGEPKTQETEEERLQRKKELKAAKKERKKEKKAKAKEKLDRQKARKKEAKQQQQQEKGNDSKEKKPKPVKTQKSSDSKGKEVDSSDSDSDE